MKYKTGFEGRKNMGPGRGGGGVKEGLGEWGCNADVEVAAA